MINIMNHLGENIMTRCKNFLLLLCFLISTCYIYAKDSKKILILHSYHESFKWTGDINRGMIAVLKENFPNAIIYCEYMDAKRHPDLLHKKNLFSTFKNKYSKIKFDLILTSDNNAFDFVKKYNKKLFHESPVVFNGVNYLKKEDTLGFTNFTGISEIHDLEKNYNLIKKLQPKVKSIVAVIDSSDTGKIVKKEITNFINKYKDDAIKYSIITDVTLEELKKQIEELPKESAIIFASFGISKKNTTFNYYEVLEVIEKLIDFPIYGTSDMQLNHGIIGGYLSSGYHHGVTSAKMGISILKGEKPQNIPKVYKSENNYIFDYIQLQKSQIKLENLPFNSVIINKPFSFYETYKVLVIGTTIFILILFALLIVLLLNIKKRKKVEHILIDAQEKLKVFNRELEEKVVYRTREIQKRNDELKQTQNQLIESEKMASLGGLVAGVAHEINTPIGICLTAVTHFKDSSKKLEDSYANETMTEEAFENYLKDSSDISSLIYRNIEKTAELVKSFKQIAVDQTSEEKRLFHINEYLYEITASLQSLIKQHNVNISIICPKDLKLYSYAGAFSQIITNLIINSINHAFGTKPNREIIIKINVDEEQIFMIYSDNGKGIPQENQKKIFDPFFTTNRENGGTGLGLNIIYNIIVNTFGGSIQCKSIENEGVDFIIILPFKGNSISSENSNN